MKKAAKQKIFVISGPSRVGKDAITRGLLRRKELNLQKVITATSRVKRRGEVDGRDFYFFTPEEFEEKVKKGYFLEWALLSGGRYYGTPVSEFDRIRAKSKNVIMNIEVQGARQLSKMRDDVTKIFIKPDSVAHLIRRMKEAGFSKEETPARLTDCKRELKDASRYDYRVVNREGKLEEAIAKVADIIQKEINRS